ncbi:DinB family protein [Alkalihalobacillus sp. NPDC078783]
MIRDLQTEHPMQPVTNLLYAAIEENYQRLCSIVKGINQELLDYKGEGGEENSIAQLIKHLSYVDLLWVYRFKGGHIPNELETKYGPMVDGEGNIPDVSGVPLECIITDYQKVIDQLQDFCLSIYDEHLSDIVEYETEQATIRWGLWHLSDHSRYHQAHINLLIKTYKSHYQ